MGMKILVEIFLFYYIIYYGNIFFSLKKDSSIMGNKVTLVKDQRRLDIRKYPFSQIIYILRNCCQREYV